MKEKNMLKKLLLVSLLLTTSTAQAEIVSASWYETGSITANGEKFRPDGLTVAHKKLPFGTILKLTRNGKSIIVRVNDRGPFIKGRTLDLSRGAARALGCIHSGICKLKMSVEG
jgi:rare lipoprotein A